MNDNESNEKECIEDDGLAKDYFKHIHPEQFSDSYTQKVNTLTREAFSFYLDKITTNGKEKDFERFCEALIKVSICPNLLPQTGPTGGGDSKVDSETIPVAEELAENWLYGYADNAHSERWAFAFSAKKAWKQKYISDIKKIIETNTEHKRGYKKIFFVTNQMIPDKKRAEAEYQLRKEYPDTDIRILDGNWILNTTFIDNNVNIAVDCFNMSDSYRVETQMGHMDKQRSERLAFIEQELKKGEELKDTLRILYLKETVELSREQEVDYPTIIGILDRNVLQNKTYGSTESLAVAYYDYCWTVYWWYNQYEKFYEFYQKLEQLFLENPDRYSILKNLSTLWMNLNTSTIRGNIKVENFDKQKALIHDSFNRFINDDNNPKRSLLARQDYQQIRMSEWQDREAILREYEFVLDNMEMNNDIDLDNIKQLFKLPFLKDCSIYEEVFEKLIDRMGEREKHISSAELLLNRGDDHIENDPYRAIKYYSRAISQLYYDPTKAILIQTYLRFGAVFQSVGLYWASRTYLIRALMESFHSFFDDGFPSPGLFLAAKSLKYNEICLGRLEYSLNFNEFELFGRNIYPYDATISEVEGFKYDLLLSMVFLKEDFFSLEKYIKLPNYLKKVGLEWASSILKYKLGYPDEEFISAVGGEKEFEDIIQDIIQREDFDSVPSLNLVKKSQVEISTTVLGCRISVSVPAQSVLMEFASTLLSMVENIFATSISDGIYSFESSFSITIQECDEAEENIQIQYEDKKIIISISHIDSTFSFSERQSTADKLFEISTYISVRMLNNTDSIDRLKKSIEEENTMFRTIGISSTLDSFLSSDDSFLQLPDGVINEDPYVIKRTTEIYFPLKNEKEKPQMRVQFDPEQKHIKMADIKHSDIVISDLIDVRLWDAAGWKGLISIMDPTHKIEPIIAFIYEDSKGYLVFEDLIKRQQAKKICLGIIKGISKENPLWYRAVVGEDQSTDIHSSTGKIILSANRSLTINAETSTGLDTIERICRNGDSVTIMPIIAEEIGGFISEMNPGNKNSEYQIIISTKKILIKTATEINDTDVFLVNGLMPDDIVANMTGARCYAEEVIDKKKEMFD